jgi:tRNA 2-thiouridine synthesizing protein A
VKTAKALKDLPSGTLVEVLATDPGSVSDFAAWARSTGNELVTSAEDDDVYRYVIRKR